MKTLWMDTLWTDSDTACVLVLLLILAFLVYLFRSGR